MGYGLIRCHGRPERLAVCKRFSCAAGFQRILESQMKISKAWLARRIRKTQSERMRRVSGDSGGEARRLYCQAPDRHSAACIIDHCIDR